MIIREASICDIEQIQIIRHSVRENILLNPELVTDRDCEEYLLRRGRGWVCETDGKLVGFSIVDLLDSNVWALFVLPAYEKKGIGGQLHDVMLGWYFGQCQDRLWLSTEPNTRAEAFYRSRGWKEAGTHGQGEIKFLMHHQDWLRSKCI